MGSLVAIYKEITGRVMHKLTVWDVSFVKISCLSLGVLIGGVFPALTRSWRKFIWYALFILSVVPLAVTMVKALCPKDK